MSSFIGIDHIGVWVTSGERNALLDWIAQSHPALDPDVRSKCLSEAWRWPGCGVDLRDIFVPGQQLAAVSDDVAARFECPSLPLLLTIVNRIHEGSWQTHVSSPEATEWRRG